MQDTQPKPATVAVERSSNMAVQMTPRWFVSDVEYSRKPATFGLLINGEEAFREIHKAIAAATKSVCIICWGFQPSMFFIRDEKHPCIGKLLEQKAREGKKIRVLSWSQEIDLGYSNGITKEQVATIGVTGFNGEPNTPGRRDLAIKDRLAGTSDWQHDYSKHWFAVYDAHTDHEVVRAMRQKYRALNDDRSMDNLVFRSRGFSAPDRASISTDRFMDKGISAQTRGMLASFTTHHQKMVLVDHESADLAVGFVMGHNMLDWYWDTNEHSVKGRPHAPNKGANAQFPRQDFSSRVTGPILADLYDNFQAAWNKAITDAPGHAKPDPLPTTTSVKYQQKPKGADVPLTAQILRTQHQGGADGKPVKHIAKMYLQAVSNATQLIYIENQYFRWPVLADQIKQHAKAMAEHGRRPEKHGSLYLFVITNTSDEGMGDGANNTQRMLEGLGRGADIPAATRDARIDRGELPKSQAAEYKKRQADVDAAQAEINKLHRERNAIDNDVRIIDGTPGSADYITQRYESVNTRLSAAEQRKAQAQKDLDDWTVQTISASEMATPGLKTLVCRIVSPDTAPGQSWVETYVHAKLMIIDDTFMTLGSANINTRSMETDSELNIIHDRPEVSKPARQTLWDLHTKNFGGQRIADLPLKDAYDAWETIVQENINRRKNARAPVAPLDAFLRLDPSRKDWD
ncbi:phosphatidylserine/phosphatidylglycerophosphate/cardiolipin synthase family protein [Aquabacterium sp. NJ1]|uniref:phospholipase D-like domain-containing protein n=1 Tax=Aquabacterium sp. NJ1 TaxID=1538295 RepID=UPI0009DD569E|nr:phospholipase D-like domain-containing protein [Aquabacterium sp. NJ1]